MKQATPKPLAQKRLVTAKDCRRSMLFWCGISVLTIFATLIRKHVGPETLKGALYSSISLFVAYVHYTRLRRVQQEGPFEEIVAVQTPWQDAGRVLLVTFLFIAALFLAVFRPPYLSSQFHSLLIAIDVLLWMMTAVAFAILIRFSMRRNDAITLAVEAMKCAEQDKKEAMMLESPAVSTSTPASSTLSSHWWTDSGTRAEVQEQPLRR